MLSLEQWCALYGVVARCALCLLAGVVERGEGCMVGIGGGV